MLSDAIAQSTSRSISAANLLEVSIVADGSRDAVRSSRFDRMLEQFELEVVPVTPGQVRIARQAYRDYGRGSGHAANLNFGDCFSYALAADRHTDIRSALAD